MILLLSKTNYKFSTVYLPRKVWQILSFFSKNPNPFHPCNRQRHDTIINKLIVSKRRWDKGQGKFDFL